MSDSTPSYTDLSIEDSWIQYLRARLPYSFSRISARKGAPRQFTLYEPILLTGTLSATHHNYWRRGHVHYVSGKLLDYYSMPDVGQRYRTLEVKRLMTEPDTRYGWCLDAFAFYNSMQLEKVWGLAQSNHLDRERVMMTSVSQAVELCLKAITSHASFRGSNCFKFNAGHDIAKLYRELPDPLQDEIAAESKVFAKEYVAFRTQVEADLQRISGHPSQPPTHPDATQQAKADWEQMARRIRKSNYTAFVNSNDPGATDKQLHEGWFEEALNHPREIQGFPNIIEYLRYAPRNNEDELPIPLVNSVLLLGRFMYEHLFPVPLSDDKPHSGFPIR